MLHIKKGSQESVKKFSQFITEENLGKELLGMLKEKIREDLYSSNLNRRPLSFKDAASGGRGWYAELLSAIIDASRTADIQSRDNVELFGKDEVDGMVSQITVKSTYQPQPMIFSAEFMNEISFSSTNEDVLKLLDVRFHGGEFLREETTGDGSTESKTYTFNAQRGFEMTSHIENRISKAINEYFVANYSEIDEELNKKFEEWMGKNGVDVEKGK